MKEEGKNGYTGQLKGPFSANEDLIERIRDEIIPTINDIYLFKIGIYSKKGHYININNQSFEIGRTNILEVRDTNITSLHFEQDEDLNSFVDYIYKKE